MRVIAHHHAVNSVRVTAHRLAVSSARVALRHRAASPALGDRPREFRPGKPHAMRAGKPGQRPFGKAQAARAKVRASHSRLAAIAEATSGDGIHRCRSPRETRRLHRPPAIALRDHAGANPSHRSAPGARATPGAANLRRSIHPRSPGMSPAGTKKFFFFFFFFFAVSLLKKRSPSPKSRKRFAA